MARMGNERHLKSGSMAPPPPGKDVLRVYGMKFCPYVQRLKLVLTAKEVKHETINIDPIETPDWYFAKNPRGFVPTLEVNDVVLPDSIIASEYVDSAYTGKKLMAYDPLQKAKEAVLLKHQKKTISGFYALGRAQKPEEERLASEKLNEGLGYLDQYLAKSGTSFIAGIRPGFSDYMAWPIVERIEAVFPQILEEHENVRIYYSRMLEDEIVKSCKWPDLLLREVFMDYFNNGFVMCDVGEVVEYDFPY